MCYWILITNDSQRYPLEAVDLDLFEYIKRLFFLSFFILTPELPSARCKIRHFLSCIYDIPGCLYLIVNTKTRGFIWLNKNEQK